MFREIMGKNIIFREMMENCSCLPLTLHVLKFQFGIVIFHFDVLIKGRTHELTEQIHSLDDLRSRQIFYYII